MVLPYITVSIVASLGSLRPAELRVLGLRAAAVIGGLWVLALSFAFLIPLTFPSVQNASFFSSSLVERRPAFDFVDLYIPANPFNSLANNVVPAVVLFSLILGVALVGVQRRERLVDVLLVARDAISAGHAVRDAPDALWTVCHCRQRCWNAWHRAAGPAADVPRGIRRGGAACESVGAAGTCRRAHPDPGPGRAGRVAQPVAHRAHRRRPLHRAARADARQPHPARPARSRRRGAGPADRGHRAGLLQLPAHGKAALSELRAVRGLVRRRAGAAVGLSRSWR